MKYFSFFTVSLILLLGGGALIVSAQGYAPLETIPNVTTAGQALPDGATGIGTYLASLFRFLIALAGAFAIVVAITGGVQFVTGGISPSQKTAAKERIANAFIGLTLVLSSYLLLNSINPTLVAFNLSLPSIKGGTVVAPVAGGVSAGATVPEPATGGKDPLIEDLQLSAAAYLLKEKYPKITFTSGFRSPTDQLRVMAQNVAQSRNYIQDTYKTGRAVTKLQAWVTANPSATSVSAIEAGLDSVLKTLTNDEIAGISKHLTGDAFDVLPRNDLPGILDVMRTLPGKTQFLTEEGGMTRWHVAF